MRNGRWLLLLGLCLVGCDDGDDGDDGDEDGGVADQGVAPTADFPPAGADLVFAAIGDFGDTVDLADDDTDTRAVADRIKSWDPAFILTVGDNDYSDAEFAGTNRGLELGVGQYFHDYIGDYTGSAGPGAAENRFFPIPGDHDYGDDCDNPRLDDYLAYFTLPGVEGDERYYRVRRGDVEVFALDTIIDCHQDDGAFLARQAAWLAAAAADSDARFKIVLVHQPPYSSGARHGSAEHTQLDYAGMGIDLVLAGDDHIYERVERDGVTYLVIGLGGVDRHEIGAPVEGSVVRFADAYGALGLAVARGQLHVAFITDAGRVVDRFALGEATAPTWYQPGVETRWQWQLQGTVNASYDVEAYDIDLLLNDAATIASLKSAGHKVICYFSAGSYEDFRADAGEFLPADLGATLDGFPDERWLDVRSPNVLRIMRARLDVAVQKGCDAVEPDNMDGYANDNGVGLTAADQLTYNRLIADEAHQRGLGVGLKNDLDQIPALVDAFDFAVNEQCHEYDECEALAPFTAAGKAVFVAEYAAPYVQDADRRARMCTDARGRNLRTLVLPEDLDDSFRHSCDAE